MNQLDGKYVNIVLSVEGGRGMDFVRHPMHVTANYNSRILESEKIPVENRAAFNTELIWEVDKKDLRKLRSTNQPLRVECISTDIHNRRDRIGFVLLSLRSAQIIPLRDAKCRVSYKWHKLIGCQADKKKYHPEIYLALAVRDHLLPNNQDDEELDVPLLAQDEEDLPINNTEDESNESTSEFPIKYLDDGYIQIGNEPSESFSLILLVKEARNLDILLPETLVFRQNSEKYQITFKLFGVTIKTKPFYKNIKDKFPLNEKVVVRILASQETLFEFFNSQTVLVHLYNGHELLGTTFVKLNNVAFEPNSTMCYFQLPHNIEPFGDDETSPLLNIWSWIKRSTDQKYKAVEEVEKPPTKIIMSNLDKPVQGCGDQIDGYVLDRLEKVDLKSKSEHRYVQDNGDNVAITQSVETIVKNIPLSPKLAKTYNVFGNYVQYVLEITLQSLVWRIAPKERVVIFKFSHPKASNYITICTQVSKEKGEISDLKNIGVKVCYVSTVDQIENFLNAWPAKLVLTDEKEKLLNEEYEFDNSKFFCDETRIYRYIADLKAIRTHQPLARLHLTLNIKEMEIGEKMDDRDFYLFPPLVDELLTIKEIADIEKWKKTQRDTFEKELDCCKQIENEKLEKLWKDKTKVMEQKLESQMQKCKHLQEELQKKVNNIKTEKYLIRRKNRANIFQEIFNENWETYSSGDKKDIIELLSKTQRDNEYLRKLVEDQRNKLQTFEKTTLTKEQTSNLLQELKVLEKNFEETQNSKKYFKEQWKLACDEIHEIKTEEYKNIQLNLKRSKEELSQLSLDHFGNYVEKKFDLTDDCSTNRTIQNY